MDELCEVRLAPPTSSLALLLYQNSANAYSLHLKDYRMATQCQKVKIQAEIAWPSHIRGLQLPLSRSCLSKSNFSSAVFVVHTPLAQPTSKHVPQDTIVHLLQHSTTMHTFVFEVTQPLSADDLRSRNTHAKIRIEPYEAYVDAVISPSTRPGFWSATVEYLPKHSTIPDGECSAVLCLSRGELGRSIGTIQLGSI